MQEGLAVRRLNRKRLPRTAPVNAALAAPSQEWALDFLADGVASGRGIRILTLVGSFTRDVRPAKWVRVCPAGV